MMTRDNIITLPNAHLRQKSERVHVITDEVKKLIKNMEAATLDWEDSRPHELGVALAAIQIDDAHRVVIIRNDFDNKDDRDFLALINPKIVKYEGKIEYDHEGCLSVKDIYGLVPRYSKVRVEALDADGKEVKFKAEGFLARILQHEVDHTNGIVFIDHIKNDDAFYKLNDEGELEKIPHDEIIKSDILW
ncbi:MAG: peptide deformylase [Candidatus Woesebacteria bacterium]|jgi:peptide deformylase